MNLKIYILIVAILFIVLWQYGIFEMSQGTWFILFLFSILPIILGFLKPAKILMISLFYSPSVLLLNCIYNFKKDGYISFGKGSVVEILFLFFAMSMIAASLGAIFKKIFLGIRHEK